MPIMPILEFPHMMLRQRAKKIRKIDKSVQRLADDMVDTLHYAGGVGLAANQVGVLRRLIVIHIPEENDARVYINPEIVHREGEREVEEGCLSVPGYVGTITRAIWVKAKMLNRESKMIRIKAEELLAQVLEHEIDHLNGILYLDHLKEHQELVPVYPEVEQTAVV